MYSGSIRGPVKIKLEKVAIATHCNLRLSVVHYETHDAPAPAC